MTTIDDDDAPSFARFAVVGLRSYACLLDRATKSDAASADPSDVVGRCWSCSCVCVCVCVFVVPVSRFGMDPGR